MKSPYHSTFFGALLAVPFIVLNYFAQRGDQWFIDLMRGDAGTTTFELVILFGSLGLMFVGGLVALSPLMQKGGLAACRLYILNIVVGALLIAASVALISVLGVESYRCEILRIPNCD